MLTPVALVAWQWSLGQQAHTDAVGRDHPTGSLTEVQSLLNASKPLHEFYESSAFTADAAWFSGHDASTVVDRARFASECTHKGRVFLPILHARISDDCTTLLVTGGIETRLDAFTPILVSYLRACRQEPDTTRPDSPYTDAQWATLVPTIAAAVSAGCPGAGAVSPDTLT